MDAEYLARRVGLPGDPKVSIVMPTYKRADQISSSIQSVLNQTFADFELIISDDCSLDRTDEIVRGFDDNRIRYRCNSKNLGMPGNLISGIKETKGTYILVCHDHDLYDPSLIEKMVVFLETNPNVIYVHSGVEVIDQSGNSTGARWVEDHEKITDGRVWMEFMMGLVSCPVCANTMVRRSAHEKYGLYAERFGFIADVEMWLRLGQYGDVGYINEPLIRIRLREDDHKYVRAMWDLIVLDARIKREYNDKLYVGWKKTWKDVLLALRIERLLLRLLAGRIWNRDWRGLLNGIVIHQELSSEFLLAGHR